MAAGPLHSDKEREGARLILNDPTITRVEVLDLRFPTSRESIGSDAVNKNPDYSAAYCILHTDSELKGYGLTFTLGRGNELCVGAARYLGGFVQGRRLSTLTDDLRAFSRQLTDDSQFRWLGPEKGVTHMAAAAVINAVWDLYARQQNKPLWRLLADMSPREIVRLVDFRYIDDAITEAEALALLEAQLAGRDSRIAELQRSGYPAYTTSVGWFGFSDEKIRSLCHEALAQGWRHFKLKVGGEPADDLRRAALVRGEIGGDTKLMMDANQRWGVKEAIDRTRELAEFDPWWMEEPTSPDDILGHARIRREAGVRIATGEHCQNRVIFKQLLQAGAIDVCQIDSCRLAGVNENLAVLLMAAKFGVPVCPHAGGVGLCEYVQHLSAFDYIAVSGSLENRVTEYVDHLHEHFVDPVRIRNARYVLPCQPGYSAEMYPQTLEDYRFPDGKVWRELQ
jgi:L-fuconate dehydratase